MVIIYIKLGTLSDYREERLNITLSNPGTAASADQFDYNNINGDISSALNAGGIVQINEAEYWTIKHGTPAPPPLQINTNYLLNLTSTLTVCPDNNAKFFLYQNAQWYGILWSKIKSCLVATKAREVFLVGKVGKAQNGDTTYVNATFIGKDMAIKVLGINLYTYDEWDLSTAPDDTIDYCNYDKTTGTFTRPASFKSREIVECYEV